MSETAASLHSRDDGETAEMRGLNVMGVQEQHVTVHVMAVSSDVTAHSAHWTPAAAAAHSAVVYAHSAARMNGCAVRVASSPPAAEPAVAAVVAYDVRDAAVYSSAMSAMSAVAAVTLHFVVAVRAVMTDAAAVPAVSVEADSSAQYGSGWYALLNASAVQTRAAVVDAAVAVPCSRARRSAFDFAAQTRRNETDSTNEPADAADSRFGVLHSAVPPLRRNSRA